MSETETSPFEDGDRDEAIIATRDDDGEQCASEPAEVDWGEVWDIAGADRDELLSPTQASLCVQVSDQCPPTTDKPGKEYLARAADAGCLEPERVVADTDGGQPTLIIRGFSVAGESA